LDRAILNCTNEIEYIEGYYFFLQDIGVSDPLFAFESYYTLPIRFIEYSVEQFYKKRKNRINRESLPLAYIASGVYGFAGSKDATPDKFLPYPIDELSESKKSLKASTCKVFIDLLNRQLLPEKVISASHKYIETIARYQ
jgi:hypothetical protein